MPAVLREPLQRVAIQEVTGITIKDAGGQTAIATARVRSAGVVRRIAPAQFRELMAEDADVSDLVLRVLLGRCESLRRGEGARVLEILGSQMSPATRALHTWASRQELPHTWLDVDDRAGQALARAAGIAVEDLPAVITPTAILRLATAGEVADLIGLAFRADDRHDFDVVVVGGGPGGSPPRCTARPRAFAPCCSTALR